MYSQAVTLVLKSVQAGCDGTQCHPDVIRNADEFLTEVEYKGANIMTKLEAVEGPSVLDFRAWFSVARLLTGADEAQDWLIDGLNTLSENEHVRPAAMKWGTFRSALVDIGKAFAVLEGKDPSLVDTPSPPAPVEVKPAGFFDKPALEAPPPASSSANAAREPPAAQEKKAKAGSNSGGGANTQGATAGSLVTAGLELMNQASQVSRDPEDYNKAERLFLKAQEIDPASGAEGHLETLYHNMKVDPVYESQAAEREL